jgi:hypothetical protein
VELAPQWQLGLAQLHWKGVLAHSVIAASEECWTGPYWRTDLTLRQLGPLFRISKSAAGRIIDHPVPRPPVHRRERGQTELPGWKEEHNRSHRRVRARVEHVFARMKSWRILRGCRLKDDGVHPAMLGIPRCSASRACTALPLPDRPRGRPASTLSAPIPLIIPGKPLEAVVFPDLRAAFSLVGQRVGGSVGVVACRVVAPVEVVDAVGRGAAGTV